MCSQQPWWGTWLPFVRNAGVRQVQVQLLREDVNKHRPQYEAVALTRLVTRGCFKALQPSGMCRPSQEGQREGGFKGGSPMYRKPITNQEWGARAPTADSCWRRVVTIWGSWRLQDKSRLTHQVTCRLWAQLQQRLQVPLDDRVSHYWGHGGYKLWCSLTEVTQVKLVHEEFALA